MTLDEIINEIHKICDAAASESYDTKYVVHKPDSDTMISRILSDAKKAAKRSMSIYESFRSQIADAASTHTQYENAIRQLAGILRV